MFFLFYLLWIVFNGRITLEILLIGLPIALALAFFSARFLDMSPKDDLRRLKKLPRFLKYLCFLMKEILLSALHVMKLVWTPSAKSIKPCLKTFHTGLKTEECNVVLADSITLTPGTITVHAEGDRLTVHCLDASLGEGLENNDMLRHVSELEADR